MTPPAEMTVTTHSAAPAWVTRSVPKLNAELRLFCFPYAGGGSVIYHHWPRYLPDAVEVLLAVLMQELTSYLQPDGAEGL